MKDIYVIHQSGEFHNDTEYDNFEEAQAACRDQVLLSLSEHNPSPIYICKAVMKFSPDQTIVIKGEAI